MDADARVAELARLAVEWADCRDCALAATRTSVVVGDGDPQARLMFVGEAPGFHEDRRGIPFVGQAGQLLDALLAGIGLTRADCYIANVLKCRPPNNRTPDPLESEACRPYLERQVELIRPKLIVALGKSAASLLLHTDATIASLRGRVHQYRGVPLVVTYHPAYLLRNLPDKAKAWEDMLLARRTVAASERGAAAVAPPVT
jgi:uracil-DNA glycosylase